MFRTSVCASITNYEILVRDILNKINIKCHNNWLKHFQINYFRQQICTLAKMWRTPTFCSRCFCKNCDCFFTLVSWLRLRIERKLSQVGCLMYRSILSQRKKASLQKQRCYHFVHFLWQFLSKNSGKESRILKQ